MKKYLLVNALCLLFICSQAQPVLNELYITPGSSPCNGTTRQEFFEIYNGNQGNGNAVSNIGCYYLITRWETGGGGIGNEGFYVIDFPSNAITNSAGFFTASASTVFGTQTGNGNPCQFTANLNWNSGVTKKYTLAAGNTYTSATVTNLFNLFDESLSQLTVLLYNGTAPVDAFVGGGGGNINNILARIHAWPPLNLTIDCVGTPQNNTITFTNITASDIDAVNQAAGTDNGFIRKYDGNCATWDKSSSPPFHTPGSPNNGGVIPTTEPFWTSSFSEPTCPTVPGQNATTNDTIRLIRNVTSVTYYVYRDINLNGSYDLGLDPLFGSAHPVTFPANATSYTITGIELPVDQTSFVVVRMSNGSNCFYTQNIFTTACAPLPVVINSFTATRKGNTAVLNWQTQTEINAKAFDVEILSGNTYTKVASVAATNNPSGSSYNYIDNNTAKSTSLYRLKLIDKDNSFRYSEVRSIKGLAAVSDFSIYPNPSSGSAKVMINDVTEGTQVQLIDNTGRTIKTITLKNSNSATLTDLQRGVYLVKVINTLTNEQVVKKLTVN
jgi:hypothetical protein